MANYNLQAFTDAGLSASETASLTQYAGSWYSWNWTWTEGAGDGVVYTFSDWTIHKNADGSFYVVKDIDGFTSGNFSPDANGLVTITFNWQSHTAIKFKPPSGGEETLIKTVDNSPVTGGTSNESFDPAAWVWEWYSDLNQLNDIIRTTIVNISGQPSASFVPWLTDKISGITSGIPGAVIEGNPNNPTEYVVTIDLPEDTIKDSIIFITDNPNDHVIGEVDFEPVVPPVPPVAPVASSVKVFRNFW